MTGGKRWWKEGVTASDVTASSVLSKTGIPAGCAERSADRAWSLETQTEQSEWVFPSSW